MKWSYTIYRSDQDLDAIQKELDSFGQEGWEMVSFNVQQFVDDEEQAYDQYTFLFKRQVA